MGLFNQSPPRFVNLAPVLGYAVTAQFHYTSKIILRCGFGFQSNAIVLLFSLFLSCVRAAPEHSSEGQVSTSPASARYFFLEPFFPTTVSFKVLPALKLTRLPAGI